MNVYGIDSLAPVVLTRDAPQDGEVVFRELELDRAGLNVEARTVPASLSSELKVKRWWGTETLAHKPGAVMLGRAAGGLPLLFNHDRDTPIGIVRDVKLEGAKLVGVLHFSNNTRAAEVFTDVREGFLSNVSIGYRVHKWEKIQDTETGNEDRTASKWEPFESSVVTIPGDPSIGINRAGDGTDVPAFMHPPATPPAVGATLTRDDPPATPPESADVIAFRRQVAAEEQERWRAEDATRRSGIRALFAPSHFGGAEFATLRDDLLDRGASLDQARSQLLALVSSGGQGPLGDYRPTPDEPPGQIGNRDAGHVSAGDDAIDRFSRGAEIALLHRGKLALDADPAEAIKLERAIHQNVYRGMTLSEMAREYLRVAGIEMRSADRMNIVGLAFTRAYQPAHGTSDFANLLENVANKALMAGYQAAPETWQLWCGTDDLRDFKEASRVNMSGFSELDEIGENGEYKLGNFADLKETLRLSTFGKLFNISRQAIINDDVGAFTRIPNAMGEAASRKIGDLAYALLIDNRVLKQDGKAVFHADHNNRATTAGRPTIATLTEAFTKMGVQLSPKPSADEAGYPLNLSPRFILVPKALEIETATLVASQFDPAGTAGTLKPNPFNNRLTVVTDARLDIDSTAKWYLAAQSGTTPTIVIAFLDGNREPFTEQQDGWTVDGVSYKVRHDLGGAPLDYRGLYVNAGAAGP